MAVSKAQQKAVNKYVKENYERIVVNVQKGERDLIKAHAESKGESVNAYICRLIREDMKQPL